MFEVNEFIPAFTWQSYTNGGLKSLRPGQRCEKFAIDFASCAIETRELDAQALLARGIDCHRTDRAVVWSEPVLTQAGKRQYPVFAPIDGTADSDYVCVTLLDSLPPQA